MKQGRLKINASVAGRNLDSEFHILFFQVVPDADGVIILFSYKKIARLEYQDHRTRRTYRSSLRNDEAVNITMRRMGRKSLSE